jgi:hypothetical protein
MPTAGPPVPPRRFPAPFIGERGGKSYLQMARMELAVLGSTVARCIRTHEGHVCPVPRSRHEGPRCTNPQLRPWGPLAPRPAAVPHPTATMGPPVTHPAPATAVRSSGAPLRRSPRPCAAGNRKRGGGRAGRRRGRTKGSGLARRGGGRVDMWGIGTGKRVG